MLINEIYKKIIFCIKTPRIGPDLPFTHWMLHYKSSMYKLCKKKFYYFADNAEMRPGSYAVGCDKISIGSRVIIRPGTMLFGETSIDLKKSIIIEDDVMMGCGVHIYVNNHKYTDVKIPLIDQGYFPDESVILKRGCWIGANAVILAGVVIGENSVIGAGSVVTKSVPKNVIAAGTPAKIIKTIC
jgi:acetyltransferase-like isoleucine patch superfamily enzyme